MSCDSSFDCLIAGSGFSGSLLACILSRQGQRVLLVDRGSHPRFAVGESSTPLADLLLEQLSQQWDVPELAQLARFGKWRRGLPDLCCGLKRGFSFFRHQAGQSASAHAEQMLVTASSSDEVADTHWYRAEVDNYLVQLARRNGVTVWENSTIDSLQREGAGWHCQATREQQYPTGVDAGWVVDATGPGNWLGQQFRLAANTSKLRTRSCGRYSHFNGVPRWHDVLQRCGASTQIHPFPCDDAAVHHLLEDGWMWMLRFANGVTSVGRVWNRCDQIPPSSDDDLLGIRDYPVLRDALGEAVLAESPGRIMETARPMQRCVAETTGDRWALMPGTAVTLDPLFSTGIASGVAGVQRLAAILLGGGDQKQLENYGKCLQSEVEMLDLLVDGAYRAMSQFELFCSFSMLFFAAAISSEEQLASGMHPPEQPLGPLWLAEDRRFGMMVRKYYQWVCRLTDEPLVGDDSVNRFTEELRREIEPYNTAGLLDPQSQNMYHYTGNAKNN